MDIKDFYDDVNCRINLPAVCDSIDWNPNFYNPTGLFNLNDLDGLEPEIFFSISNRGPGKTYSMSWIMLKYTLCVDRKIMLISKTQNDLGSISEGVLYACLNDNFKDYSLIEIVDKSQKFSRIFVCRQNGEEVEKIHIGFVCALSAATKLKNFANLFNEVDLMFLDEFQTEDMRENEVNNLVTLHDSVARGGKNKDNPVRYVPVVLASNSLSVDNVYFHAFHISTRIQSNTHFLRGNGFVLERFYNDFVAEARRKSAFYRALEHTQIAQSNIDNAWLNDDKSCVERPTKEWGTPLYIATLIDRDKKYGVKWYSKMGDLYFIDRKIDKTCKNIYNIYVNAVENTPMIRECVIFKTLRRKYFKGQLRFNDISLKNRLVEILFK